MSWGRPSVWCQPATAWRHVARDATDTSPLTDTKVRRDDAASAVLTCWALTGIYQTRPTNRWFQSLFSTKNLVGPLHVGLLAYLEFEKMGHPPTYLHVLKFKSQYTHVCRLEPWGDFCMWAHHQFSVNNFFQKVGEAIRKGSLNTSLYVGYNTNAQNCWTVDKS